MGLQQRAPWIWKIRGYHSPPHFQSGALFAVRDSGWDHALKVTASGKGAVVRVSGDRPLVITAPDGT
jgi:hypothetical protein